MLPYAKDSQDIFLFKMVERANAEKKFLVHNKVLNTTNSQMEIRKIVLHLRQELKIYSHLRASKKLAKKIKKCHNTQ